MSEHRHPSPSRMLGIVLIVVAVLMVAEVAWFQAKRSSELNCQSAYNEAVAKDRAALNQMIFTIVNPKATPKQQREAITEYVEHAQKTDLSAPDCG